MTPAIAWRCCAAVGVVAFLCSWGFGRIPGLVACGPTGGLGPILAFEFVTSPADVAALFGGEPCRSTLVGAQKIGLLLDALAFIPAYTTFLILATMASATVTNRWPPFATMLAFAGLCDEIEGGLLYLILSDLPGSRVEINSLWWAVHAKFTLLAVGTAGIGWFLLIARRPLSSLGIFIICGGGCALVYLGRMPNDLMVIYLTMAWVTILICALLASWKPSFFSAPAAPPPAPASPSA